jgi:hypothetical protein
MSQQENLENLIRTQTLTLQVLEERRAKLGGPLWCPPGLEVQIIEARAELERLQTRRQTKERRRLETLLRRVHKNRIVATGRPADECDLHIVKSRGHFFVFLARLTDRPMTEEAAGKIATKVTDSYDLDYRKAVWVEYLDRENRYYLRRPMWQAEPEQWPYIDGMDAKPITIEEIEQWLGLPHEMPASRSA